MKTKIFILSLFFAVSTIKLFAQCTPNAGLDASACGQTCILQGQVSQMGSTAMWSSNYPGVTFLTPTQLNVTASIPFYSGSSIVVNFILVETNGGCVGTDTVKITFVKPPHAEAGMPQSICGTNTQLAADTVGSGIINGWWTSSVPGVIITPSGTDPIPWNPNVDASLLGSGFWINGQRAVWFYWNGQNSQACIITDSVLVTFYQIPNANAGLDTAVCGKTYNLEGVSSITNNSGIWSMLTTPPNPGSANFISPTSPTATVTVTNFGYYYFVWKEMNINNTACFDRDTIRVEFKINPMPDAGLDIAVCGIWANLCATPSIPGGQWSCPQGGIAYYDAINGNYNINYKDSACTTIRHGSPNQMVTMYWFESNGVCTGYDSVNVFFGSIQPAITLVSPADSVVCGPTITTLNAQQPAYGYGYWMDTIQNTNFIPSPTSPNATAIIDTGGYNYSGFHNFYWITVVGNCRDTSDVVRVRFKVSPIPHAGLDRIICGQWANLNATPLTAGSGEWLSIEGGVAFYDTINGNLNPSSNLLASTWIKSTTTDTVKNMVWAVTYQDCYLTDTIKLTFENCGFAGPDDITCGQSYTFNATPNFGTGSTFLWSCINSPVLFSNNTVLNPDVILPNYSPNSTSLTFVLTEVNIANSFSNSDTVIITFFEGCNEIKGKVYYDSNNNHIFDLGDYLAVNKVVRINNDFVSTNNNGDYNYIASSGNYNISLSSQGPVIHITPLFHSAIFTGSNSIDSLNNFAISLYPDTNLITYCAIGAARPGFACDHYIYIHNAGLDSVNSTLKVVIDPQIQYNYAIPAPDAVNGNILEWFNIPITFYQCLNFYINTTIPVSLPIGTIITDSTYVYPIINDYVPENNISICHRTVSNSFDPNEKTVEPLNGLTSLQLANGNYLNYTIQFQNTGTDTAFTVVLKDTLSSLLNVATLEITGYSHPFTMQILGQGTVIWTFPNILLPDSNTNEPLSKGHISYKIKPNSNLTIGDHIENTAYIYFDYNLPIVTNTTTSYILNPYYVPVETINENNISIYPNPFTDNCNIQFSLNEPSPVLIEIYDIIGNKIATLCNENKLQGNYTINYNFENTNVEQFYLIRMVTNKGQSIKKAVKL